MPASETVHRLYGGKHVILYDDHRHTYRLKGQKEFLTSATAATGSINKPHLYQWYADTSADYVQDHLEPGKPLTALKIKSLVNGAREAPHAYMRKKGDLGTDVHNWIEDYIRFELKERNNAPADPNGEEMENMVKGFLRWVNREKPQWLWSERIVYHPSIGYVGTCDGGAVIRKKRIALDWKSGKAVYPEYCLQVTGYAEAAFLEDQEKTGRGILHIDSSTGKFSYYPEDRIQKVSGGDYSDDLEAFFSAVEIAQFLKRADAQYKKNVQFKKNKSKS